MGRGRRPNLWRLSIALPSLEPFTLFLYSYRCSIGPPGLPFGLSRPKTDAGGGRPERTRPTVRPRTVAAPAFFSTRAPASKVAPVVNTSSTSRTRKLSTFAAGLIVYAPRTDLQCSVRESTNCGGPRLRARPKLSTQTGCPDAQPADAQSTPPGCSRARGAGPHAAGWAQRYRRATLQARARAPQPSVPLTNRPMPSVLDISSSRTASRRASS